MAKVYFELSYDFAVPPKVVWDELIDWKGHEAWIPATQVELRGDSAPTEVGAEFTAWTGLALGTSIGRKLALEDRMQVAQIDYDDETSTGHCRVVKLGPLLTGHAAFTVTPAPGTANGAQMRWVEDITVAYAPQFLAPVLAQIGKGGFRFGMSQLAKQLRGRR